jgi:hypothetical protein
MYASIRKGKIKSGTVIAEVVPLINSRALPILSSIPGFKAAYVIHDDDDTFIAISIFADRTAADQSNGLILDWLRQNLGPMLAGPPEVMVGEIVVHRNVD